MESKPWPADARQGRRRLGRASLSPARHIPRLSSHRRIVLVDPRGMGKTTPKGPRGRDQSPFGADWREAYVALAIARPLLGQRVADLLDILRGARRPVG